MASRSKERLGSRYEVLEHLSTGGMAEVHRGRYIGIHGFEKVVAIKRIRPMLLARRDAIEMFLNEAKLAATMNHPNVVEIYDIGLVDGCYFYSMEYIEGPTLLEVLRTSSAQDRRIPLDVAVAIAAGACAGLDHAHRRNVIHCDISPSNLMVRQDGLVKIIDFGIARAASAARPGIKGGKPSYMSPEQCRGETLDRRTDIFSIGIVLHEMITHERLFFASEGAESMRRIMIEEPPPPSACRSDCPPELDWIVGKALRKRPELRYQRAEHMQRALESFAQRQKWLAAPPTVARYLQDLSEDEPTVENSTDQSWVEGEVSSDPTDLDTIEGDSNPHGC